jgi:hypothetical protein
MPTDAHLTLLRPAIEGAIQARWLLDPTATPQLRVCRALGAALDDLNEYRKIEQEEAHDPDTPPADGHRFATRRIEQLKHEAMEACLMPERFDTTELLRRYAVQPHGRDLVLFRRTSGVLHGTAQAADLGENKLVAKTATWVEVRHSASQRISAELTIAALNLFEAALQDYEGYVVPPPT